MQRTATSIIVGVLGLALAACAGGGGSAASAVQLVPWNQAGVTQIAKQLSSATEAWQLAVRQQGDINVGSGAAEASFGVLEKSQAVTEQARSLAGHLEAGQGREQTLNQFRDLQEVVDDVDAQAPLARVEAPTQTAWSQVTGLMKQLSPFYGVR